MSKDQMQVFFSWSGEKSKKIAQIFVEKIPMMLQFISPFYSEEIEKGDRWQTEIALALKDCQAGVLFITPENMTSSWLIFEAGALSKIFDDPQNRVYPLLFGVEKADLKQPLGQFQATKYETENEFYRLIKCLNGLGGNRALSEDSLKGVFSTYWPIIQAEVQKVLDAHQSEQSEENSRSPQDMLKELLVSVREMKLRLSDIEQAQKDIDPQEESSALSETERDALRSHMPELWGKILESLKMRRPSTYRLIANIVHADLEEDNQGVSLFLLVPDDQLASWSIGQLTMLSSMINSRLKPRYRFLSIKPVKASPYEDDPFSEEFVINPGAQKRPSSRTSVPRRFAKPAEQSKDDDIEDPFADDKDIEDPFAE